MEGGGVEVGVGDGEMELEVGYEEFKTELRVELLGAKLAVVGLVVVVEELNGTEVVTLEDNVPIVEFVEVDEGIADELSDAEEVFEVEEKLELVADIVKQRHIRAHKCSIRLGISAL